MSRFSGEITAVGAIVLGRADKGGALVGSWLIQLTDHSSTTASITVKGKAVSANHGAYQAVAYKDMADGTVKTAALVTANLPLLILVDAAGLDIELDCTAIAGGGVYYDAEPVLG